MQTISCVSITRQGRFLFWLKLLLLFFKRLFKSQTLHTVLPKQFFHGLLCTARRELPCARATRLSTAGQRLSHRPNGCTRQRPEPPAPASAGDRHRVAPRNPDPPAQGATSTGDHRAKGPTANAEKVFRFVVKISPCTVLAL